MNDFRFNINEQSWSLTWEKRFRRSDRFEMSEVVQMSGFVQMSEFVQLSNLMPSIKYWMEEFFPEKHRNISTNVGNPTCKQL